jgi:hypothetical protein
MVKGRGGGFLTLNCLSRRILWNPCALFGPLLVPPGERGQGLLRVNGFHRSVGLGDGCLCQTGLFLEKFPEE